MDRFPCPCCGYLVHDEPPGSYNICPICFWEDDLLQLRFLRAGGANRVNLIEAQKNFAAEGVSEVKFKQHVRLPESGDQRESDWRPIDKSVDNLEDMGSETDQSQSYPDDLTTLYYWRPTYWRRPRN